jgi:magnesium transporter
MIKTILEAESGYQWIDVISPSDKDLRELVRQYKMPAAAVKDCMAAFHMPKVEPINDWTYFIVRYYDLYCEDDADTIQEITNKVAIFVNKDYILTIHRTGQPTLAQLANEWRQGSHTRYENSEHFTYKLLDMLLKTYELGMNQASERLDAYEKEVFQVMKDGSIFERLYQLKRRGSVFKRMLYLTKELIHSYMKHSNDYPLAHHNIEFADSLYYRVDELHENANNLINLRLSLASHRTNEIMGILTIFSVFFLPLTFIVGVYGMNFKFMPELESDNGYGIVWIVMITIVAGIYIWFKKKGWV